MFYYGALCSNWTLFFVNDEKDLFVFCNYFLCFLIPNKGINNWLYMNMDDLGAP